MFKKITIFTLTLITLSKFSAFAQENKTYKGTIKSFHETSNLIPSELSLTNYEVTLNTPEQTTIKAFSNELSNSFKEGDQVFLLETKGPDGTTQYFITDIVRTDSILVLFLLFIATVVLISKGPGLMSIAGMSYSFLIIFKILLPQLYKGTNPILITMLAVILIAPVTFVLSHGFNKKTFSSLIATLFSLGITSIIAIIFINGTHLTGFGSEEAYFLQLAQEKINIKGLFLAGIIIGTLGILDDATVTQTAIVQQLKFATRGLSTSELFKQAMQIGHDHIASTVNTLILVYTGASLPLLLLFINSDKSFSEVLNNQIIAEEVVTMLVSSIGLIISIPIATLFAAVFISGKRHEHGKHTHGHFH